MEIIQTLFEQMDKELLESKQPSKFFNNITDPIFISKFPFTMLSKLKSIDQSPKHHPEGNVWNHTMLVIDNAAERRTQSSDMHAFMWAALLHDIGKATTTMVRKGKITSYDHDKAGAKLAQEFLQNFTKNKDFITKVVSLIRWHMQILFVVNSLRFADIKQMKEQVDINDIALLGLCDRLGRLHVDKKKEEENIKIFLEKCQI